MAEDKPATIGRHHCLCHATALIQRRDGRFPNHRLGPVVDGNPRMLPVFVCAYTARLPISISDTMLKRRNGIATARMNRERTFTAALQGAVCGEVCNKNGRYSSPRGASMTTPLFSRGQRVPEASLTVADLTEV